MPKQLQPGEHKSDTQSSGRNAGFKVKKAHVPLRKIV